MAHLLGSKSCIESLSTDVSDIQEIVIDILSRVGPVNTSSWKYPYEQASEVDVDDLLNTYAYSDDTEDNQHAHIILFELVIDRLLLALHGFSQYIDVLLTPGQASTGVVRCGAHQTSVGLVVKRFWNCLIQIHSTIQQLQSQNKTQSRLVSDLESTVSKQQNLSGEIIRDEEDNSSTVNVLSIKPSRKPCSLLDISHDISLKATQTIETAFVPCESCDIAQKSLRNIGDNIIKMCQSQDLPSCLQKFKSHVLEIDWLTASEISQWACEQNKDLNRITKHFDHMTLSISELKRDLSTSIKNFKQTENILKTVKKEVKSEKNNLATMRNQYEIKCKTIELQCSEIVESAERQKAKLESDKQALETEVCHCKQQLQRHEAMLSEFDAIKKQLDKEIESNAGKSDSITQLENDLNRVRATLNQTQRALEDRTTELNREQTKISSSSKHSQSLQSKQSALMRRIESLVDENSDVRDQMERFEDELESLGNEAADARIKVTQLEKQRKEDQLLITRLRKDKSSLESTASNTEVLIEELKQSLEEIAEREKLLAQYPDLHGPVNNDCTVSGDVRLDMENQVKANSIRIRVLEEENQALRNSIEKMLGARAPVHNQQTAQPESLWTNVMLSDTHSCEQSDITSCRNIQNTPEMTRNSATGTRQTNKRTTPTGRTGPSKGLYNWLSSKPGSGLHDSNNSSVKGGAARVQTLSLNNRIPEENIHEDFIVGKSPSPPDNRQRKGPVKTAWGQSAGGQRPPSGVSRSGRDNQDR